MYAPVIKQRIIQKGIRGRTSIPTKSSRIITTRKRNQSDLKLSIYEGEDSRASKNTVIYDLEIKGIPPAPAGVPKIEVTLDLDHMVLRVSAKDLVTHQEHAGIARPSYAINKDELEQRMQKFGAMQ